jgi:hypothetical protein
VVVSVSPAVTQPTVPSTSTGWIVSPRRAKSAVAHGTGAPTQRAKWAGVAGP